MKIVVVVVVRVQYLEEHVKEMETQSTERLHDEQKKNQDRIVINPFRPSLFFLPFCWVFLHATGRLNRCQCPSGQLKCLTTVYMVMLNTSVPYHYRVRFLPENPGCSSSCESVLALFFMFGEKMVMALAMMILAYQYFC